MPAAVLGSEVYPARNAISRSTCDYCHNFHPWATDVICHLFRYFASGRDNSEELRVRAAKAVDTMAGISRGECEKTHSVVRDATTDAHSDMRILPEWLEAEVEEHGLDEEHKEELRFFVKRPAAEREVNTYATLLELQQKFAGLLNKSTEATPAGETINGTDTKTHGDMEA